MPKYKETMSNWVDGTNVSTSIFKSHNLKSMNWTNITRITLKNGVHAYKSDQGVFYPDLDGTIGYDKVPMELIPDE